MKTDRLSRLLALTGALALLFVGFFALVRPWYRQWGATDEETRRTLPGDEIVPDAAGQETRAITVHAPIEAVWPWLAQLGQDRGGFYSFDLLENLVGCDMPAGDSLRPDRQAWQIGDRLWMYPPDKAGGVGFATLRAYVPGRALAFGTHAAGTPPDVEDGSWAFVLEPVDAATTRFLIRGRGAPGRSLLGTAFDRTIFEPVHFVMERRTMIGLKQLAEGASRHRGLNDAQVVLWAVTFGLFVAAGVAVFRRRRWGRALAAFVAAGVVFQALTLGQPSVMIGLVLVGALGALLWWPVRRPSHAEPVMA